MSHINANRDRIIEFIHKFKDGEGYSPSVREIATTLSLSVSTVQHHISHLEKKGLITKGKLKFRSLEFAEESSPLMGLVPALGVISAGQPLGVFDDESTVSEHIHVPPELSKGHLNTFALRVVGNSMVDAMISDGDIIIMEKPNGVKNGDVVAVWIKSRQETTLKKIYFENSGQVRLQPCNPYMMPLFFGADDIEVQGKLIGVMRSCV
jgi:repressor LexA